MKTLVDVFIKEEEPENLYLLFLENYQNEDDSYPELSYMADEDIFLKIVDGQASQLPSELVKLSLGEENAEKIKSQMKMNKVVTDSGQELLLPDESVLSEL